MLSPNGRCLHIAQGLCVRGEYGCPNPRCAGGGAPSWGPTPHDCPSKVLALARPSDYMGDPLLRNWTKLDSRRQLVYYGSTRDPSSAWRTAAGGEWRFTTFSGHVYNSPDFVQWSTSNESLFGPAECPSLFPLPAAVNRTGSTSGAHPGRDDVAPPMSSDWAAAPTHVYKGSGIYCLKNGEHVANCPHKDWFQLGVYTDGPANTTGTWGPSTAASFTPGLVDAGIVYASKDFAAPGNRRLLIGWATAAPASVMTVPRELRYDGAVGRLAQSPVVELEVLRAAPALVLDSTPRPVDPGTAVTPLFPATVAAHWIDLTVVFKRPATRTALWLDVLESAAGNTTTRIGVMYIPPPAGRSDEPYNVTATVMHESCPGAGPHPAKKPAKEVCAPPAAVLVAPGDTELEIRVLVDGTIIEAYFLGGRMVVTTRTHPLAQAAVPVAASVASSAPAVLVRAEGYTIDSMWVPPSQLLR